MTKKPILLLTSLISLIAFIAFSCAPSANIGGKREGIAGSISYVDILGAVESPISPIPTNGIIPSAAAVEYSIVPELPAGLMLIKKTGVIEGTPRTVSPSKSYVVTASGIDNYMGEIDSDPFSITIGPALSDQTDISSNSSIRYENTTGTARTDLTISPSKNIVPSTAADTDNVKYSIEPTTLPGGLNFDSRTGVIDGIPLAVFAATDFVVTVTATAPYTGSVESNSFTIVIVDEKSISGSALNYSDITGTTETSLSIEPISNIPSDADVTYSIDPLVLPDGLRLIESGVIEGTPRTAFLQTTFQVTATATGTNGYTGAVTSTPFKIAISNSQAIDISEYSIAYDPSNTRAGTLLELAPTSNTIPMGAGVTYSIKKPVPLPDGVMITEAGVISVSENTAFVETTFQVTATGTGDYAGIVESNEFNIEVRRIPTTGTLLYASSDGSPGDPISLFPTLVIDPDTATVTYSISSDDSLPNGLSLASNTGRITGSVNAPVNVTLEVTATANGIYSGTVVSSEFTIDVQAVGGSYAYPSTSSTLIEGNVDQYIRIPISRNSITPSGVAVRYEKQSNLPEGLSVNEKTGAIEGTPTEATTGNEGRRTRAVGTGVYTGTVFSEIFHIKINGIGIGGSVGYRVYNFPGAIDSPFRSDLISFIEPAGATVRYERFRSLPEGLEVDPITGSIVGEPTELGSSNYQMKAVGIGKYQGIVYSDEFLITITEPVPLTGGLSYPTNYDNLERPFYSPRFRFTNNTKSVEPNLTGNLADAAAAGAIRYTIAGTSAGTSSDWVAALGAWPYEDIAIYPYNGNMYRINNQNFNRNLNADENFYHIFEITATGTGKYVGSKTTTLKIVIPAYLD